MTAVPSLPTIGLAPSLGTPGEPSPEQLLISALLETGTYTPGSMGVPDQAFRAYRGVHEFALAYQADAGEAPPVDLVKLKFPSFVFIPDVHPAWAAREMRTAETNRELRKALGLISNAIAEEAHGEAIGHMHDAVRSYSTASTGGVDATDWHVIDAFDEGALCPVPPGYLSDLTGGHRAGEFWLITALWGVGKSWKLIEHAGAAMESGWNVVMFSIEMSSPMILHRLHAWALRGQPAGLWSLQERREWLEAWYADCGSFTVYGPDTGRVDASVVSGAIHDPHTLVVIDYVGKMYTIAGQHAREDYKAVANISSELCEVAAMHKVPMLAAAQLNRMGQVAGAMELERDPDLIIEVSRVSDRCDSVRKNVIKKARNTQAQGLWWSRFDAVNARFEDITGEEALAIRQDEENAYL
jgi:hypothetical protein